MGQIPSTRENTFNEEPVEDEKDFTPSQVGYTRDGKGKIIRIGQVEENDPKNIKSNFTELSKLCYTREEYDRERLKIFTDSGENYPEN